MSGMRNLANAVANDPGFAKEAGMSAAEAKQFVESGKTESRAPMTRAPVAKGK